MIKYIKKKINKKLKLEKYLEIHKVDGILFNSITNRFWLSEFISSEGYLLFMKKKIILYLDSRYITDGKKQAKNITHIVEITNNNFFYILKNDLIKNNIKILAFENDELSYFNYKILKNNLSKIILKPINFSKLRAIKTNKEINLLKKACSISDIAINDVINKIKVGISEKQIEQIIINNFIELNADKPSFDIIVTSGFRGALPHGRATNKIILNNELITIDFGCVYKGYCSDMTRTIGLGKPTSKMLEIYNIVYEAQNIGISMIKPGILTSKIDKICRDYIYNKNYGKYFTHSLGHGIGIKIHEFPYISSTCNILLETGMIITIEPGIYIPNLGGVRIEDVILVTKNGYCFLTKTKRDLILI